ncbi:N-formimino-L-glutamate deiminase [Serratia odorifera]|uniref:N-formimino-L-glutamate deiminase n=1 Tax=Serratia odorifera TaxID=618 RepID=A0A3S4F1S8_SEROD|nr:N-formimino-L-glutamate deiminase [Serratia odorifera]
MRWFEYGQRLRDRRRNRLTTAQQPAVADVLYQQALQGGAQACGVALGQLTVGYRADWLVLDGNDPYLAAAPDASILNRWLFAGGKEQIRDVFVGGRQVIEQGQHALQQQSSAAFMQVLKTFQQEA